MRDKLIAMPSTSEYPNFRTKSRLNHFLIIIFDQKILLSYYPIYKYRGDNIMRQALQSSLLDIWEHMWRQLQLRKICSMSKSWCRWSY